MNEEAFRIAIPRIPPWFIPVQENNVTRLEGTAKSMLDYVTRTMSRPFLLLDSKINGFGIEIEPGNWTGSLGMMHRNEADAVIGLHFATEKSYQWFGYTSPAFATKFGIVSGPPRKYKKLVGSLLSTITLDVWIALTVTWIVISCLSYLMAKVERSWFQMDKPKETLSKTLFAFWGLLFERGFDYLPSTTYRRLLLAVWLILCEVLMSGIGGNLSSKMAVKDVPERIDSIQNILDRPYLCPYIPDGILLDNILKLSTNKLYQGLQQRIQSCNGRIHIKEFISSKTFEKVNKGSAVVLANDVFVIPEFVSSSCRGKMVPLYLGKERFSSISLVMVHRKHLDFSSTELYRRSAITMMHAAAVRVITNDNSRYTAPCYAEAFLPIPLSALSLTDLAKVFQVWIIGLAISPMILLGEFLVKISKYKISSSDHEVSN